MLQSIGGAHIKLQNPGTRQERKMLSCSTMTESNW
jgi:hypothetical protein